MDVSAVLRNLKEKGISEVLAIHKQNKNKRLKQKLSDEELKRANSLDQELRELATRRPYADKPIKKRRKALKNVKNKEEELKHLSSSAYKNYVKWLKAHYIKEVIPKRYKEASTVPVTDKVVFMEKNTPNSAPNGHISKVLKEQGKYEVVKIGLGRSKVSNLEMYENAVYTIEQMADAKAFFISSGNPVLSHFDVRPETKVIQLWHGCGCFKKVGYSTIGSSKFGMSAAAREEYDEYRNYSYVCLPAEDQAWVFEDAMHIPADSGKLVPVGVSRTDVFYDPEYSKAAREVLEEAFPQIKGKKIIFYAPTYRGRVSSAYAPDQLDVEQMAEALGDEYVLLIKHHGFAAAKRPPIPEEYENTFAYDMNANSILSIEKLLTIADICITDYSSIGFEYAILERPIIFFAYDVDQYLDERGMYYDYEEITPGPICKTTEEIVDYVNSLASGFDTTKIKAFKEQYVGMCDGHATERTIALIES